MPDFPVAYTNLPEVGDINHRLVIVGSTLYYWRGFWQQVEWINGVLVAASNTGGQGPPGDNGLSAYQIAVLGGFNGTPAQWLESLIGATGSAGNPGEDGLDGVSVTVFTQENPPVANRVGDVWIKTSEVRVWDGAVWQLINGADGAPGVGTQGPDGRSAYQVAVDGGFVGNQAAWLASLVGAQGIAGNVGPSGISAYQVAVNAGFVGSQAAWLASLVGATGQTGQPGQPGTTDWNGITNKPATFAPIIGSGAAQAVAGNDSRLTDARPPNPHTHAESDVTALVADLALKVPTARTVSTSYPLSGGGDLSANRTLSGALTTSVGLATATTSISTAALADVAGASVSLAAGTWLLMADCFGAAVNAAFLMVVAITDGANAVVREGAQNVPASGTASVNSWGHVGLSAIVSPGSTTTYKIRAGRGNAAPTGTWITQDGSPIAIANNASDNSDKATGLVAIRLA